MAAHYGLNIYLATTHALLDTIPMEECAGLSIAELKTLLSERHPTMCSIRTQLLYQYTVLQDEVRIIDYPEMWEEGILCVEAPARAPTRTEGLMLHHALADKDKDQVLQMLREGLHPGFLVSSDDGATHNLLQAALVGDFTANSQDELNDPDPQLTRILINARAEVNLIDDSGITPLILATTMEYPAGIRVLLSHLADPNRTDQLYEEAPLHYAIQHNSEVCVQALLEGRANPLLSSETSEQLTPRELAEYRYRFRMCSQLIHRLLTTSYPEAAWSKARAAMEKGFPERRQQQPDWLMEVDVIEYSETLVPDRLKREELEEGGFPVTAFQLPLTQDGQETIIHILYSPTMPQGGNTNVPAGWVELLCFPDELSKTVLYDEKLVRITEGQHHLVHESGLVIYGSNKRVRCRFGRLLNEEPWFCARDKITVFERKQACTEFEAIPFSSCGNLGYSDRSRARNCTAALSTQYRVMLPTGDFNSPYIWTAKLMYDALLAIQQSIQKAELLLNALESPSNGIRKEAYKDLCWNLNKSKTGVAFLLEQFAHIAQRGSCEVVLDV
eukprot:s455_g8.t1